MKSRRFIDSAILDAQAGNGGNGVASFLREKYKPHGGPDGGDGGSGGSVILQADINEASLEDIFFQPIRRARHGEHGAGQRRNGKTGSDLIIKVPCGTEIWDRAANIFLGEVVAHGDTFVAARGGKGGLGNCHWKSSTHQTPLEQTDGEPGEKSELKLELKLVADVGLVGYPNAGKSSLLTALSNARPKVAAYPFTTLNPIIGTVELDNYERITIADIPGLIENAHKGVGLGFQFLRHIERARILVFVIDMAGVDGREPYKDYLDLKKELELYKKELADRPTLVVANKMDLPESAENLAEFIEKSHVTPIKISVTNKQGIRELLAALQKKADSLHDHEDNRP